MTTCRRWLLLELRVVSEISGVGGGGVGEARTGEREGRGEERGCEEEEGSGDVHSELLFFLS